MSEPFTLHALRRNVQIDDKFNEASENKIYFLNDIIL